MENENALGLGKSKKQKSNGNEIKSMLALKSIFFFSGKMRNGDTEGVDDVATTPPYQPLPFLSPLANSVVSRCCKILQLHIEELQHQFDSDLPDDVKQPLVIYARNFLEFCSFQALQVATTQPNYLSDKDFRRLMFDMMLAWEAPGVGNQETAASDDREVEDEDSWSLFYSDSTNMAVQVDDKKTVGAESFSRIAPACAIVADIITVHNLFDVLASSSGHRLHFLIYDKYLRSLEKVIKAVQNLSGPQMMSNLSLAEEEIILEVDGTVPTQPVLKHMGISAWPGRLTLTNYALYFESGMGLYDKAVRFDLASDLKQIIKPELTGPLGARLFDKAVMYKSSSMVDPAYFEFPEFKGSSRRDYWLDICLEIFHAHKFTRKYNIKEGQQFEALARAVLGIYRYRAVREAFKVSSSNYKTLLCFNLAESLPRGDAILETLSSRLTLMKSVGNHRGLLGSPSARRQVIHPVSRVSLCRLGIISCKEVDIIGEATNLVGDVCVGEVNPLENAVKQSMKNIGRAEAAQATVDQVKVEGIDTNLAVMKELLFPLFESINHLQQLASWKNPWKSMLFMVLISYAIIRGWINYALPALLVVLVVIMLWHRNVGKGRPLEPLKIIAPPPKNAVEQLLLLQEAISQLEALIQSGNIILLKVRALIFAVLPQATDRTALVLVIMALAFAFVPLKHLILFAFLESFTTNMPLRKISSERDLRRIREWWIRIPAAPVQLIKPDDKKTR
ncbi:uncharacterized protein LOC107772939 isoform X1 [Nicotiana tabacum]|uniref:Uncharacterized protein LOC107772939 isoform X1 n=2 Tax=Nicotiana tabacum TaxID=4097 RepID=A0A1S3Y6W2_TOBAC|nr:PREDICTED: uncharacterized protein LOC107772939 isoform X1 [Nicotiana tabacum]